MPFQVPTKIYNIKFQIPVKLFLKQPQHQSYLRIHSNVNHLITTVTMVITTATMVTTRHT